VLLTFGFGTIMLLFRLMSLHLALELLKFLNVLFDLIFLLNNIFELLIKSLSFLFFIFKQFHQVINGSFLLTI